jgi:hypothetical protein
VTRMNWNRVNTQKLERRHGTELISEEDSCSPYCRCPHCDMRVRKDRLEPHLAQSHPRQARRVLKARTDTPKHSRVWKGAASSP